MDLIAQNTQQAGTSENPASRCGGLAYWHKMGKATVSFSVRMAATYMSSFSIAVIGHSPLGRDTAADFSTARLARAGFSTLVFSAAEQRSSFRSPA